MTNLVPYRQRAAAGLVPLRRRVLAEKQDVTERRDVFLGSRVDRALAAAIHDLAHEARSVSKEIARALREHVARSVSSPLVDGGGPSQASEGPPSAPGKEDV